MTDSRIIKNIFSLTTADLISKIIIFLYTAYLARTILTEGLGAVNLAQSIVAYLIVLTNGMDTYGVKMISRNKESISSYVNSIFSLRMFLAFVGYAILILIVFLIDKDIEIKIVILIFGLTIFAQGTYLNWVFMGIERMEVIAVRLIAMSILNLAGILTLIHSPADTWLAASIIAASQLINSAWMILYYIRKFGNFRLSFNISEWIVHFSKSLPFGLTFIIISFSANIGIILIGFLISTNYLHQTGVLGASLKIMIIAMTPLQIIQLAFFPQLSAASTKEEKISIMKKFTKLTFLAGSFLSVLVFFYSDILIGIAYGDAFYESAYLLKYLSAAILFMYIGSSFSIPLMAWGRERTVLLIVLSAALVNLLINLVFIPLHGMYAVAVATVCTEFTVLSLSLIFIIKAIRITNLSNLLILISLSAVSFLVFWYLSLPWYISITLSTLLFLGLTLITKQLEIRTIKNLISSIKG